MAKYHGGWGAGNEEFQELGQARSENRVVGLGAVRTGWSGWGRLSRDLKRQRSQASSPLGQSIPAEGTENAKPLTQEVTSTIGWLFLAVFCSTSRARAMQMMRSCARSSSSDLRVQGTNS